MRVALWDGAENKGRLSAPERASPFSSGCFVNTIPVRLPCQGTAPAPCTARIYLRGCAEASDRKALTPTCAYKVSARAKCSSVKFLLALNTTLSRYNWFPFSRQIIRRGPHQPRKPNYGNTIWTRSLTSSTTWLHRAVHTVKNLSTPPN